MVSEQGQWAIAGAVIALVLVVAAFSYMLLTQPVYTEEQKIELNKGITANCTICLAKEHTACTATTVQDSHWGAICDQQYVRNCTASCRRIT